MPWVIVPPAVAAVMALVVLALLGRRIDAELVELRGSLRRMDATGVASDELRRTGSVARDKAKATGTAARRQLRRPRLVGPRPPR